MKDTAGRINAGSSNKSVGAGLPAKSDARAGGAKSQRAGEAEASGTNVVTLKGRFRVNRSESDRGLDGIERETSWTEEFNEFAETLKEELRPIGLIEALLADQVALAAWRLRGSLLAERVWTLHEATDQHLLGPTRLHCEPLNDLRRDTDGASRRLQRAVDQYEGARAGRYPRPSSGVIRRVSPANLACATERFLPLSTDMPGSARLVFDLEVSDRCPVVKGTRVTVDEIARLILEGKSWSEIAQIHPELTKDDIRSCVWYTTEQNRCVEADDVA